jgi:hypothetical protein
VRGLALVGLLTLGACGGQGAGPLMLSWAFADNRSCADQNASVVSISADGMLVGPANCRDGQWPAVFMLDTVARTATLDITAFSPSNTEIARGSATTDVLLSPITVTLYLTGGR